MKAALGQAWRIAMRFLLSLLLVIPLMAPALKDAVPGSPG